MKKLKLQMQMTVDGFVAGPNGELDWMEFNWSDDIKGYVDDLTDSVDTIIMGRKMTDGFISYWSDVVTRPDDPQYAFGRKMVDIPKVVFTKTLKESDWENTKLAKGELVEEVNRLKKQNGKDVIVYGGAGFVSSLIQKNLIDEYNFFVNPAIIGQGLSIFGGIDSKTDMQLVKSKTFDCGVVLNQYKR
jgi:dihydrofolate reductase